MGMIEKRKWLIRIRSTIRALVLLGVTVSALGVQAMAGVFKKPEYQSNLSVSASLMSRSALVAFIVGRQHMGSGSEDYLELSKATQRYLVVEAKNTGNQRAWGNLVCKFSKMEILVHVPDLPPHMKEPNLYVIEVSGFILPSLTSVPTVEISWKTLEVK